MSNRPNRSASHSSRVQQASRAGSNRNAVLWIALAAVVVVAGIVAVAVARSGSSSGSGGSASPSGGTVVPDGKLNYGPVEVKGTALPQAGSGTDAAIGATIPTVEGQTFDGSSMSIAPDGKPKVIMGVAHWCPHCQAEVPRLQQWLDANGMPSDVQLVSIATATNDTRPNFPPGDWLRREKWSVPTLVDDENSDAGAAMGISGFPAFVVVGADGKVVFRTSGELTMPQWEQLLQAARSGQAPTS